MHVMSCASHRAHYIMGITSFVSHRVHTSCILPAGEMVRKNKCPRKCNLFWARKVIEIFKYSDHFSGTEYARNSFIYSEHFRISVE